MCLLNLGVLYLETSKFGSIAISKCIVNDFFSNVAYELVCYSSYA